MGNFIGNIIALIITLPIVIWSFFSAEMATKTYAVVIYLVLFVYLIIHFLNKPHPNSNAAELFSSGEFMIFRKFYLAILYPGGAAMISAILNAFRLVGVVWGVVCIVNGAYLLAGSLILYYFVSGPLIAMLNPYLYMSNSNNPQHHELLMLLQGVARKFHDSVYEKIKREDEKVTAKHGE